MFQPINPPPSDHHNFSTGHSTEYGDNPKTVAEKVNAGFKHVYDVLASAGHDLGTMVPDYFGKFEAYFREAFHTIDDDVTALKSRVTELEADIANIKMMVQGLGFAGVNSGFKLVKDDAPLDPDGKPATGGIPMPIVHVSSEPVVTVKEVTEQ